LRQALPPEWEKLSASISRLQANPLDRESREQSVSLSHRLRGTAGSLGLHRVSACAGKIEDYLIMLDPADSTEYDLLWGEIIRALADGEGGLGAHEAFDGKGQLERFYGGNVLILAEEAKFKEAIVQLGSHVDAKFFFAPTPRSALIKAADTVFDAAVIDLSIGDKTTLFHLSKGLRHSIGNKNLPLACLLAGNDLLEAADQIYLGISAIMQAPVESAELERALRTLSSVRVGQRARILTVDDDQVLTKFIQTILQTAAMQVTALNEPIKIMEVLEEARPDLILMDVIMPGLSGFDVCRMLKQNEKWRSTPLVFLTSKSDAQGRASAFQAGGEDFLSKPILSEELITRVQSQLARYRERHQDCSLDEMSGTLRREAFSLRLQDSLIIAEQGKRKLSLSMIRINGLEQAERYGIFATINAITSLGRLICARFKSDSLRGRWDDNTFLLATADDAAINVVAALRLLAQEFEKQSFTRDDGRPFTVTVTSSTAMYPGDGLNVESLMQTAQDRLLVNSRRNPADGGAISDQDEAAS
jgi:PleD family two-component response regulator